MKPISNWHNSPLSYHKTAIQWSTSHAKVCRRVTYIQVTRYFANVMVLWRGRNRSGLGSEDQDRSYRSQPQFEPNPPEFRTTTKARRSAMQLEAASSLPGVRADWDELRREARRIEGDLDVRLSSYAKLGGGLHRDPNLPCLPRLFHVLISFLVADGSRLLGSKKSRERFSLEVDGDGDRDATGEADRRERGDEQVRRCGCAHHFCGAEAYQAQRHPSRIRPG